MSDFEAKLLKYKQDSRIPCQYGDKCYQKNPVHHNKYKHPPKKICKNEGTAGGPSKKRKLNDDKQEQRIEQISDSNSDSDREEEFSKPGTDINQKGLKSDSDDIIPDSLSNSDEDDNAETSNTEIDESSSDPKLFIKEKFLVEMPDDFYKFWEFCQELQPNKPLEAFRDVGLKLVGPYDVLAGNFKNVKKSAEEYLRHWRYYFDPPELQTVLKGDDKTGYHIGYFRDSPDELPVFLASNQGTKDGVLLKMGGNIFAAVSFYLDEVKKSGDPFKKMHVGRLQSLVKTKAEKLNLDLSPRTDQMRKREIKVVARTLNKIGLVVPYNKKTELGYRNLAVTDKQLVDLLDKLKKALPEQKSKFLSDLQQVLTYASIALDECDFGTGIKLGWDILSHGVEGLNSTILRFLSNSYRLLNREAFATIAEAHLAIRKKGPDLSIL